MLLYNDFVCNPSEYLIEIEDVSSNVVTISMLKGSEKKVILTKRYRFDNYFDTDLANKMVSSFCNSLIFATKDKDLFIRAAANNLNKVWSRLGLLIWRRPPNK